MRHFMPPRYPSVESECRCPRTVGILNVKFNIKYKHVVMRRTCPDSDLSRPVDGQPWHYSEMFDGGLTVVTLLVHCIWMEITWDDRYHWIVNVILTKCTSMAAPEVNQNFRWSQKRECCRYGEISVSVVQRHCHSLLKRPENDRRLISYRCINGCR